MKSSTLCLLFALSAVLPSVAQSSSATRRGRGERQVDPAGQEVPAWVRKVRRAGFPVVGSVTSEPQAQTARFRLPSGAVVVVSRHEYERAHTAAQRVTGLAEVLRAVREGRPLEEPEDCRQAAVGRYVIKASWDLESVPEDWLAQVRPLFRTAVKAHGRPSVTFSSLRGTQTFSIRPSLDGSVESGRFFESLYRRNARDEGRVRIEGAYGTLSLFLIHGNQVIGARQAVERNPGMAELLTPRGGTSGR